MALAASPLRAEIPPARSSRGVTLIELLVAMVITLLILAVIAQVYVGSRTTYSVEEGLSRLQENARFALDTLAYDIRMAGHSGCAHLDPSLVANNISGASMPVAFDSAGLRAYRYTGSGSTNLNDWTPSLPSEFFGSLGSVQLVPYSDVLLVKYAQPTGATLTGNPDPDNANVQILPAYASRFSPGEVLLLSDCQKADIFVGCSVSAASGKVTITHNLSCNNIGNFLQHEYRNGAELLKFSSRAYFVGRRAADAPPALMRRTLADNGVCCRNEELVEDIETMRLRVGVLAGGTPAFMSSPTRFLTPNLYDPSGTASWTDVVAVQLGLLARTPETTGLDLDSKIYDVLNDPASSDDDFGPVNDRRQRQVFTVTVQRRKPAR
jgi:type IV pilus assembly protein PilW